MNNPWHLYLMAFIHILVRFFHFLKPKVYLRIMPGYLHKLKLLNYLSPADANDKGGLLDIFTWQFFAIPYKLTDPGTNWELLDSIQIDSTSCATGKLTFGQNIGEWDMESIQEKQS